MAFREASAQPVWEGTKGGNCTLTLPPRPFLPAYKSAWASPFEPCLDLPSPPGSEHRLNQLPALAESVPLHACRRLPPPKSLQVTSEPWVARSSGHLQSICWALGSIHHAWWLPPFRKAFLFLLGFCGLTFPWVCDLHLSLK